MNTEELAEKSVLKGQGRMQLFPEFEAIDLRGLRSGSRRWRWHGNSGLTGLVMRRDLKSSGSLHERRIQS